ncbi:MAG: rRNA maturation RNase YbeY [Proteobacteria bacterium]|nr:rRNA maturation RNase YbeY [Pseudomonadota bacterium]
MSLEVSRRVRGWAPSRRELTRWAEAALGRAGRGRELAVAVVGGPESRRLNGHYRGRDYPTNVLSFPAPRGTRAAAPAALGDLVICPRVLRQEAGQQGKTLRAHWAHLVVHGALHLIGYDHLRDRDAKRMERREIAVLRTLGFANPYRSA